MAVSGRKIAARQQVLAIGFTREVSANERNARANEMNAAANRANVEANRANALASANATNKFFGLAQDYVSAVKGRCLLKVPTSPEVIHSNAN